MSELGRVGKSMSSHWLYVIYILTFIAFLSALNAPRTTMAQQAEDNPWKVQTNRLINGIDDPLERNQEITRLYKEMFERDPDIFEWAGMAAFASDDVGHGIWWGKALYLLKIENLFSSNEEKQKWIKFRLARMQVVDLLAMGNNAVFVDIYWQHLAYVDGGIAELSKYKNDMSPEVFEAWELIEEGRRPKNQELIAQGNRELLRYEQQTVLQDLVYEPHKELFNYLSIEIEGVPRGLTRWGGFGSSPIPGDKSKLPEGASLADVDVRVEWVLGPMFDAMQDWLRQNRARMQTPPNDDPRFLPFFPPGNGGTPLAPLLLASGINNSQPDIGGVDFSGLNLTYFTESSDPNDGVLGYALKADKADTGESFIDIEQAAKLSSDCFFVWLSLHPSTFWVNLNPSEPDRVIDSKLGQTDCGRIMLEADFEMKKTVAKLMHPDSDSGQAFWDKLYDHPSFDSNEPVCFSFRQWIVPGEVNVWATDESIYVANANLDVELESEYLKSKGGDAVSTCAREEDSDVQEYYEDLFRSMILPELVGQVNSAPEYSDLRNIFHSLIVAEWYTTKRGDANGVFTPVLNQADASEWYAEASWDPQELFDEYVTSYTKGEFNIERQERQGDYILMRTYTYGGVDFSQLPMTQITYDDLVGHNPAAGQEIIHALLSPEGHWNESEVLLGGIYVSGLTDNLHNQAVNRAVQAQSQPAQLPNAQANPPQAPSVAGSASPASQGLGIPGWVWPIIAITLVGTISIALMVYKPFSR